MSVAEDFILDAGKKHCRKKCVDFGDDMSPSK